MESGMHGIRHADIRLLLPVRTIGEDWADGANGMSSSITLSAENYFGELLYKRTKRLNFVSAHAYETLC